MLFLVFLLVAVSVAVEYVVTSIPAEEIPAVIQEYWIYLQAFFTAAPIMILIATGRSLSGYLRNWLRTRYIEEYEVRRLVETTMFYLGAVTTPTIVELVGLIPPPYGKIASVIIIVVEIVFSEFKKLKMSLPPGVT